MSNGQDVTDYDKKFQEDLEKAQALSLETHALEKFRMEKMKMELFRLQHRAESFGGTESTEGARQDKSYSRKSSVESVISTSIESRSRPRPGSFNTGGPCVYQIRPPPSAVGRRNSVANTPAPDTSDLISFHSPTGVSKPPDPLDQFDPSNNSSSNSLCNISINTLSSTPSSLSSNSLPSNNVSNKSVSGLSLMGLSNMRSGFRDIGFDLNNLGSELSGITPLSTTSTFQAAPPPGFYVPRASTPTNLPVHPHTYMLNYNIPRTPDSISLSAQSMIQPFPQALQSPQQQSVQPPSQPTQTPQLQLPRQQSLPAPATTTSAYNGTGSNLMKALEKRDNSNLIDLTPFDSELDAGAGGGRDRGVRVSVLEAFDPLLTPSTSSSQPILEDTDTTGKEDDQSECSGSLYNAYDPFDYLYSPPSIAGSQASDPIYAAVIKASPLSPPPPPLPPRNNNGRHTTDKKMSRQSKLYDTVLVEPKPALLDPDLVAFHTMVKALREEFVYSDQYTNVGLVISPLIESSYLQGTSVKLTVYCSGLETPLGFTSDVSCSVDLVLENIVCGMLDGDSPADHVLKVWGLAEYLTSHTQLSDYEYIHQCIKLEQDIRLVLIHVDNLPRPLARTSQDDERDKDLTLEDLLPKEPVQPISCENLQILLETLEGEMEKVEMSVGRDVSVQPRNVSQAVKAVCALLGNVETLDITCALDAFNRACAQLSNTSQQGETWSRPKIVDEDGDYSVVMFRGDVAKETISTHCERIRDAVQALIHTYATAFRVDFQIRDFACSPPSDETSKLSSEVLESVLIHVECLHRLSADWNHDTYLVAGQLYHGTRPVGHPVLSKPSPPTKSLYNRVVFDSWLNFEGTSVCELPRECRLVLVVYGRTVTPATDGAEAGEVTQVELGWSAIQFFNYDGVLVSGSWLLSVWPPGADKRLGPAPAPGTQPHADTHPVLGVELPDYGCKVIFPPLTKETEHHSVTTSSHDFQSLDLNTQELLMDIIYQDTFTRPLLEDREVLWEKRHYLVSEPQALPKVLLAAHSWDYACLSDLHAMLHTWKPLEPVSALQLLLPCFPDCQVRQKAVSWIQELSSDELVDYLPQLVQALKHETYEASPLARLLLERGLTSPRVAHHLYWLLTQALPGPSPQNSCEVGREDDSVCEARYFRRLQLMLRALLAISGEAPRERFMSQQLLVKGLHEVAETVKSTKESLRMKALVSALELLHSSVEAINTCLPLSPSLEVSGIQVRSCAYFPSNTLPLKINFNCADDCIMPAIFKVGDDLQQDMLTLQMIRIMDKLWLREGLDLKMVTFACVPTGTKRGMIEMVTEAETLRKIQVELGLTGSFKDRPIAEWLAKHNPSALDYERAVANFTASCAGYSVATYVLGICDRHNDNIMLKTSGHLFHIDFGKFLGDAQMFGNFKRDRTPFVLTSDMAYVINGGDKPSAKFHHFVDLCCQAFNIVRKHGNLILNLFGLMASSGISGVTMDAVRYVQRALMLEKTNPEAAAVFARMIQSSLKSWFTQFNFFLHNLAQLRFTGDHNDGELLSFVPRVYSMAQEGRLKSVEVYGFQKRYDPDKYYVYILRVQRVSQTDPSYLFRSYKEFVEFQQKICIHFPLAKCYSLQSTSLHMGRSNIKQVAERRREDITRFLQSLFKMADEICHSDLVYTFFHPLLRDQQEASIHEAKLKERKKEQAINSESWMLRGQLKLSIHYQRGTLMVMVYHARELPAVNSGQEPSTYVKVYLLPDPHKQTKRKTKVVRRSCHPSFMEMLEYRMPLEIVEHRMLQATVWNHDPLQENEFLGGISLPLDTLDLSQETVQWHPLGNIHR